ncbi:rhomboid [Chlorella sorokiniana]|uniref:Rhomboid n=1 Tax=Chlorella sorokiniana TaxID=3076 RepID=A0A2P6TIX9_CHLSO|nr:rhomboid [Chlorella sorokiniana]|eukprot:PRW39196.1 rhomboid [Chlorella sorokiniana]
MSRALASCAARLLRGAAAQCTAAAAQGAKRLQPVASQLQGAAAARAASAAGIGGGTAASGLAAAAAAARQQTRGFARVLQFQPRQVRRWDAKPNHVLYGLMGINVAGWVAWQFYPRQMNKHAVVSIESLQSGRVWTAVTAAFSHVSPMHLGANLLGLYFFGRDVGQLFGGRKLLLLYLAGGVAGSLAHCGWYFYQSCKHGEGRYGRARWFGFAPSALGASAAVNALAVVDILLFPTRTILLYGIIPMPAALLGALWLLRDVSGTFGGGSSIAHAGHLGGAATGLAFFLAYRRGLIRPRGW